MNQSDTKFIAPLIQLAPKILVAASEVQLVIGLYEVLSSSLSGDRTGIYNAIIKAIRTKLTQQQCDQIIRIMQTTVSVIEFADKVKDVLSQIIDIYNNKSIETDYDNDLREILMIAERVTSNSL